MIEVIGMKTHLGTHSRSLNITLETCAPNFGASGDWVKCVQGTRQIKRHFQRETTTCQPGLDLHSITKYISLHAGKCQRHMNT